jgi:uncharacterized protein YciI
MPSAAQLKIADLVKGMLRLKLFVIFSHGKGLDVTPYLADHLQYMIELEREGKLFASGPHGMTIVRAADEEEVQRIAMKDPFVIHGIRTFKIVPWTVMEGSLSVTVNFSDQTAKIS